jgi:hypothetical protein
MTKNIAVWTSGLSQESHKLPSTGSNPVAATKLFGDSILGERVRLLTGLGWFESNSPSHLKSAKCYGSIADSKPAGLGSIPSAGARR